MKIFIVGDFLAQIHEPAFFSAFLELRHNVSSFSIGDYFRDGGFFDKFQNKFLIGLKIVKINKDLAKKVDEIKPDLVFVYRGITIFDKTIKKIKENGTIIFGYNNDNPFSGKHPFYMWRHFLKAAPYYDHIFVYRRKNIEDYRKIGCTKISLLRAYYIKGKNFSIENLSMDKYKCDVVFIGHWEDDGRDEYIKAIIDAGINFKLYGPEWQRSKYYNFLKKNLGYEIKSLKDDYNLALNSAKIALVFLSKLNNDTYTRRCFEITAVKTFMLSEYSDDLNGLFEKGKEADYFENKEEMIQKIRYYLRNEREREKIALAGYQNLLENNHEVLDRAEEVLRVFDKYKKLQ